MRRHRAGRIPLVEATVRPRVLPLKGNTFVTINPADDPAWYASISLLDDDTYEVERRDARQRIHDLTTETDHGHIAKDLTIWLAGRHQREGGVS
ncbi:hypothetical protein ONA91_24830 [Micromonospora sp. DR5-3]|uniref:hypothetical protein n=1 Tax=unclassified Micromonospora TaxID=2617518 RepID=UPI0011D6AC9B|nr:MULTISPECIES: hypothetical protein [unclassified Micromonospora]MCW3817683.1 hypothetical protein [Micromonospora sp. DR5-3]TYC24960.1 hypothetical protein FXF52_06475 [Micromonospora sp. MP36]